MAVATGSFTKDAGTAPFTQAIIGLDFTPKALMVWATDRSSAGFGTGAAYSLGFTDGTRDLCITNAIADDSSDAHGDTWDPQGVTNRLIVISDPDDSSGARDVSATLSSFDADGFTLNWVSDDGNSDAVHIHYVVFGGAGVEAFVGLFDSSASPQAVTGVGFEPNLVLFGHAEIDSSFSGFKLGFGAVDSDLNNVSFHQHVRKPAGHDANRVQSGSDSLFRLSDAGVVVQRGAVTAFGADGYTITWSDELSSLSVPYLALKVAASHVGVDVQKTSTGVKATIGVGFRPRTLLFGSFNNVADAGVVADAVFTVGASSSAGDGWSHWIGVVDETVTETDEYVSITSPLVLASAASPVALDAEAEVESFDADGFTLDWTTADATARQFFYVAIGEVAVTQSQGLPQIFLAS